MPYISAAIYHVRVVVESDKLPTDVYIDLFVGLDGSRDRSQSSVHSPTNLGICLMYT